MFSAHSFIFPSVRTANPGLGMVISSNRQDMIRIARMSPCITHLPLDAEPHCQIAPDLCGLFAVSGTPNVGIHDKILRDLMHVTHAMRPHVISLVHMSLSTYIVSYEDCGPGFGSNIVRP